MIQRAVLPALREHLNQKEITVLLGPRQVGKTTLMQALRRELDQSNDGSYVTLYYNLDLQRDRELLRDQSAAIDLFELERAAKKAFIFIDEIQRLPDAGLFLKGIYDQYQSTCKLIVSGSSALEITQATSEPLTGRKRIFRIYPVGLMELLHFRYPESADLERFARVKDRELQQTVYEYMIYGGYPRVVTAAGQGEKIAHIQELYESYLQKDIIGLLKVEKPTAFTQLVTLLAGQIGNLVNTNELTNSLRLTRPTVEHYLDLLEQTFVTMRVRPYATNPRTEITKMPKIYFHDLGLRNYALQRFASWNQREDRGALMENAALLSLRSAFPAPARINYWRSKNGAEVDFIVTTGDSQLSAYEIKAQTGAQVTATRSLQSFLTSYPEAQAAIIALTPGRNTQGVGVRPLWHIRPEDQPTLF